MRTAYQFISHTRYDPAWALGEAQKAFDEMAKAECTRLGKPRLEDYRVRDGIHYYYFVADEVSGARETSNQDTRSRESSA